jgi:hypothetical protein
MSIDIASKGAKQSQSFIDSVKLINHALKTANEFTKDRKEHIESLNKTMKYSNGNPSCFRQDWENILVSVGFLDISIR